MPTSQKAVRYGREEMTRDEDMAAAEVFVGDLLERSGGKVQPHSTAAGDISEMLVAIGRRGTGMELGDSFPVDDLARYVKASGGSLHMRVAGGANLATASQANIAEDQKLVSNGDGTLRAYDSANDPSSAVVAVAAEAVDNSGAAEPAYIAIEVAN